MEFILLGAVLCSVCALLQGWLLGRERRLWRWVLLLPAAGLCMHGWYVHERAMLVGLDDLKTLVDLFLAGCILLGWGAGWLRLLKRKG